jgi:hypothetical protein
MNGFLIDCFFKEFCMAENLGRFGQRYALSSAMPHSARQTMAQRYVT